MSFTKVATSSLFSSPYQGEAGWDPLRLVARLAQRFGLHRVHSLAALHDIVIGEAQDTVAAFGQVGWYR